MSQKKLPRGMCLRKDGRICVRYTRKDGKRVQKNFWKITDATNWLEEEKYKDKRTNACDYTVDEWFNEWIIHYKERTVAAKTLKGYQDRYKMNIGQYIGFLKLVDVKNIHCQKIINIMEESGCYSAGTVELTQITMHAMFKDALQNGFILRNPADGLRRKRQELDDEEVKDRRVLSREEQQVFLQYAEKSYYYNAYLLVLNTGMRCGEVGGLTWDDVDFDNGFLYIRQTLLFDTHKGGFYLGKPKSKDGIRKIPLTKVVCNLLQNQRLLIEKSKARSKQWNKEWERLVFRTHNGNPVGNSTFRMMINKIINNINLDRQFESNRSNVPYIEFEHTVMHSLRHTFATRCIENGMAPKVLQKILGHSTLSITMDLYVHAVDEYLIDEMKKMEEAV